MKVVLALALLLTLAACDKSIDEIEEQRSIWLANAPRTYAYTIHVVGWRSPRNLLHPKRVTVGKDGTSATYAWDSAEHEVGEAAIAGSYWSVARVFDELVEAKRQNAYVRARFDEERGFVERAFVDYDTASSGWEVEIREFEDRTHDVRRR